MLAKERKREERRMGARRQRKGRGVKRKILKY